MLNNFMGAKSKYFSVIIIIIVLLATTSYPPLSFAQVTSQDRQVCTNNNCYSAAENFIAAMGLLVATFGVKWLVPLKSRNFLTMHHGEFGFGGFISNSKLAYLELDLNDIPNSNFGLKTKLSMAQLEGGFPTGLSYELIPDFAIHRGDETRISIGSGLAFEKFMESKELFAGIPLQVSFQRFLTGQWKFKSNAGVYFLKMPVYRANIQFIWNSNKRSASWIDSTFGYQVQDNKIQNAVTQFIFMGVII